MALKWLRDNLRHLKFVLWGVVLVFVLLVFVDWGAGRDGGPGGAAVAIRVGDRQISEQEFLRQLRQNDEQMRQLYGEQWSELRRQFDMAGQTAAALIDRELQLEEARRMGLVISDEELREAILASPTFRGSDGRFVGAETYERILRAYFQMSSQEFEQRFAEDLLIDKLNRTLEGGVWVSDADVEASFRNEREFADFEAIMLRYERHLPEAAVDDDAVRSYFELNAEDYRREEQRTLRYLAVETSRLRRLLPVDDAELRSYFESRREEFVEGEQARASHVLIRLSPGAGPEQRAEAQARADGVAAIARSGGDFGELARKHSDDPGSKTGGGDLGWFGRGRMVKEFEDAVFRARPGDIVGPVESQFGFHVIRVDGFQPERQQSFEEVQEQVRFRVLEGRSMVEAEARAEALVRRLRSERPTTDEAWQAIADEDEAVVLNESPPFARGAAVPGTGEGVELSEEAFRTAVGRIGGPLAVPRGWIVWEVKQVLPEGVPPFEEVRLQVEQKVRQAAALDISMARGRQLLERWQAGEDPARLAEELGSSVTRAFDHRRGAAVTGLGVLPQVDAAVFAAADGELVGPLRLTDRGAIVVRVAQVRRVDPEELAEQSGGVRERLTAERAQRLLQSIVAERRRATAVTVNPELMERLAPRG